MKTVGDIALNIIITLKLAIQPPFTCKNQHTFFLHETELYFYHTHQIDVIICRWVIVKCWDKAYNINDL